MPCLTVRDLSSRTLTSLKTLAKPNHRSLNGEIVFTSEWVADYGLEPAPSIEGVADPVVARQKSEMDTFIETCGDKRSAGEIIDGIYCNRAIGREVAL